MNRTFMLKLFYLIGFFALLNSNMAMAQSAQITGRVTDSEGVPLPGVSVIIKSTTTGTVTDIDGNYVLDASKGNVVVFSFIGMESKEIVVGAEKIINVVLANASIGVDEVVVVGYGSQKKANLSGSVSSVNLDELENRPSPNTATMLQGQMSGVTVSSFSSQPGKDNPEIRIRGIGSLNAGSQPLVIVDGVESSFDQIPASDIQSISVLKDAASASIYGVRAANGVIVVTTKRGKSEKPKLNVRQNFAWQSALIKPDLVDSWEYAEIVNQELKELGEPVLFTEEHIAKMKDGSDPDNWANTNWFDEMYRTAPMNSTYVSLSGAKEEVRYMFSSEYMDQKGIMMNTGMKRYNFRSNVDVNITEKVLLGLNLSGNKRDITETLNSASSTGDNNDINYIIRRGANPTVPVRYSDGHWGHVNGLYYEPGSSVIPIKNPVELANMGENITERSNFQGRLYAEVELLKNLKYKPSLSYTYYSSLLSKFSPTSATYDANGEIITKNIHNKLINNNSRTKKYIVENLLTYDWDLNEKNKFNFLLGQSAQEYRVDFFKASVEDFPNNNIHELDAGVNNKDVNGYARELSLDSYFARVNYNFDNRFLFEFNYRYDGTSRFSEDNRWGGFPSVSAGWIVSEESFLSDIDYLSFLKVRASWGQLGNQNIGSSQNWHYYPYSQTYQAGQDYLWGDYVAPGAAVTGLANKDLTWETTTITDIGVDLNLFRNSVQVVFDWFDKTSSDILVRKPNIPATLGNVAAPFENVGEVNNRGWEFALNYHGQIGQVKVNGGFNLSHVKNKVTDYGEIGKSIGNNRITMEGAPIGSYYAFVAEGYFKNQEEIDNHATQPGSDLRPGDIKFKDISGPDGVPDGKISADYDRTIIGNPFPELTYSFKLGAGYKGFDINAFFQGVEGVDRYYWYNNETAGSFTKSALDYWTEDNRNAEYPRWGNSVNNRAYSSYWLKDASYLRLKNLEIGYSLPKSVLSKFKIENARLYMSGVNLFTWTKVNDYDPEQKANDDRNRDYPQSKVFSMGVNVTF